MKDNKLTDGDVPIDGVYWKDGLRYKRIGMSSVREVNKDGKGIMQARELIPEMEIDRIE